MGYTNTTTHHHVHHTTVNHGILKGSFHLVFAISFVLLSAIFEKKKPLRLCRGLMVVF
jgi:uncharacterized membrane protein YagU involved in acid resistance